MVLRIASRLELGETDAGPARYFDPERPDLAIAASPDSDPTFRARVAAYYEELRLGLEERGAEYVPLTTDQPLVPALSGWLTARTHGERVAP